jgi:putative transposase
MERFAAGELRFEVYGKHTRSAGEGGLIATEYTFADFGALDERYRAEAWRRYQLIKPLLALPPGQRTRQAYQQQAHSAWESLLAQLPPAERAAAEAARKQGKRLRAGQTVSRASLERWVHDFEASGGDIRSLVSATLSSGAKGQSRLPDEVERLMQGTLEESYLGLQRQTAQSVYLEVVHRIIEENRLRPEAAQLRLPHIATLYRRILKLNAHQVMARRLGRGAARQQFEAVQPGPLVTRPLERVEIDHSVLDLFVVDLDDRLPIGRPTLTYALDVFSGLPLGMYVGFEPPSYLTVMHCLLHAVMPKGEVRELFGTEHDWPACGLPETLVTDNGKEFLGEDLSLACAQLGIVLEHMPLKHPWFKGHIERHFRTLNTQLVHLTPGTSFSNVFDRGDYEAMQRACVSLDGFWEMLHLYIADYYAQARHGGLGCTPAQKWESGLAAGDWPRLPASREELRVLLSRSDRRTIQRHGIEFETLVYQSPDLDSLRQALRQGHQHDKVLIKYDPSDISRMYVYDHRFTQQYLMVPAVDQAYAAGLSLWKHRVIRAYARQIEQQVDLASLARAKHKLQLIVENEFQETHKTRSRLARWRGTAHSSASTTAPTPLSPHVPDSVMPASELPAEPLPVESEVVGWDYSYNLSR